MTEDQIRYMVNRFLGWRLPEPWNPDNGISYQRPNYAHASADHDWPTGTNLFDASQADAMVRHMLEGIPSTSPAPGPEDGGAPFFCYDHTFGETRCAPQCHECLIVEGYKNIRRRAAPSAPAEGLVRAHEDNDGVSDEIRGAWAELKAWRMPHHDKAFARMQSALDAYIEHADKMVAELTRLTAALETVTRERDEALEANRLLDAANHEITKFLNAATDRAEAAEARAVRAEPEQHLLQFAKRLRFVNEDFRFTYETAREWNSLMSKVLGEPPGPPLPPRPK